jgi:transposase-like protein
MTGNGKPRREQKLSTNPKAKAFLAALCELGNVTAAARHAGVSRRVHYNWMKQDEYREAYEEAMDTAADLLEAEARRRAVEGEVEVTVVEHPDGTKTITKKRRASDVLLIFTLKGIRPEKYRERHDMNHSGTITFSQALAMLRPDRAISRS